MFAVEDGTGVAGANSYVSLADADTYFADRSNSTWAALDNTVKQKGLLDATEYVGSLYRGSWLGSLYSTEQGLDWPRVGAYDPEGRPLDGVPKDLQAAICRLALESATNGDLVTSQDRGGQVKREKIGPIETEYADGAPAGRTFPYLDDLLSSLVTGNRRGMVVTLQRR